MLKRYTHLKTAKLVRKLEGNKHRGRQVLIDNLIPYPAAIETTDNEIRIRVLDFDDVAGIGICHESAVKSAQDALLRKLMTMMRGADEIPEPDQYLENVHEQRILMIDPLGEAA